jgi:cellulose synthase/poly-beta-1,6-N-acetylglucosamine synthase-like glycosyltransferase
MQAAGVLGKPVVMLGLNKNTLHRLLRRRLFAAAVAGAALTVAGAMATPAWAADTANAGGGMLSGLLGADGGAFAGVWGHGAAVLLLGLLLLLLLLVALVASRHGVFFLNRLYGQQRQPFAHVVSVDWPPVTVVVLAANHAASIEAALQGLLAADYPAQRLQVLAVTDHASDGTAALIDALAGQHPGRLRALHRNDPADFGAGAMASLQAATALVETDFVIVFDPQHEPAPGMVRRLMAPFCDPEVGAVTGRLVGRTDPRFAGGVAYGFAGAPLAARLTELERAGASQVGLRARANLGLAAHQAGVWGAVRLRALQAAGGWPAQAAGAEDDLHGRLRLAGWLTVYQATAELFEAPQMGWLAREAQVQEAAHGQQAALRRHGLALLRQRGAGALGQSFLARLESVLRLAEHWAPPLLLVSWGLMVLLYFIAAPEVTALALVVVVLLSYVVMSNKAAFFEQAAASLLDRQRPQVRLLPLGLLGFLGNALAALRGALGRSTAGHLYPDHAGPDAGEESRFDHRVHMVHMDPAGRPWSPDPMAAPAAPAPPAPPESARGPAP